MLPFIIGGVTLAAVSYGIKKCINDEDCIDDVKEKIQDGAIALYDATEALEEKMGLNEYTYTKEEAATMLPIFSSSISSSASDTISYIELFNTLQKQIANTSYSDYTQLLKQILNLDIEAPQAIKLKNDNLVVELKHIKKVEDTAYKLTQLLRESNQLFVQSIKEVSTILKVSNSFTSYSKSAKASLSNALVLANTVAEILNINLLNKQGKASKHSLNLVNEVQKVLDKFVNTEDEKLVA